MISHDSKDETKNGINLCAFPSGKATEIAQEDPDFVRLYVDWDIAQEIINQTLK